MVERKDVATLHPIIARCVWIGTEVHSVEWAAYQHMDHHIHSVSHHHAFVHRLHLVDPITGISRVLPEQFEIRPKNRQRNWEGGHALLSGREDVASVESREPSECHG